MAKKKRKEKQFELLINFPGGHGQMKWTVEASSMTAAKAKARQRWPEGEPKELY